MKPDTDTLLLGGAAARAIFSEIADLPVRDIHTHVDLRMVLDNEPAPDPWTALCKGDHYVTAIVESLGALDRRSLFSPDTDPFEKWQAYARIFPHLIGNQIRDWMRLTLASLGVERPFNAMNACAIWNELSATLRSDRWRPANLFQNSRIVLMSTTDNPVDPLDQIERARAAFGDGYWLPTWRPDPFFNLYPGAIRARTWLEWVEALEKVSGRSLLGSFQSFVDALGDRHDFFAERGCRASDYGVAAPHGHDVSRPRAGEVFEKASRDQDITPDEAADFQSFMLRYSMGLDFDKGWVSQIHYGAVRNQRRLAAQFGGLDSGCDTVGGYGDVVHALHDLLNHFDSEGARQHKIVLYTLDKADWPKIAGLSRIFPSVYAGISWWYFDSVSGMTEFLRTMPDAGAGFCKIGPFVTDARNIYTLEPRTQVFRRCLSTVLGEAVELRGEPLDEAMELARHLCTNHVTQLVGR